ncbi:MAG: VWA domain-containing protein [Planctomycetota bacterium]
MNIFIKSFAAVVVLSSLSGSFLVAPTVTDAQKPDVRIKFHIETMGGGGRFPGQEILRIPKVQLAILLDTSGSMDGLIDQARSQLWTIINEFAFMKQDGMVPDVEVALYEYGNDGIGKGENWVREIVGLSTDLDKISQELFALSTNGGEEYCGAVIRSAVGSLKWSTHKDDYRAIFLAGNEAFTQGGVAWDEQCKAAIKAGIVVNTIHCGSYDEGVSTKWQAAALLADGSYMAIDHNSAVVHIESPQDKDILKFGEELNGTYIPYGKAGKEGLENQTAQDANSDKAGSGSNVNRALQKKNHTYKNSRWDLIDAIDNKTIKLEDVKKEDLPEALRELSTEDLKKHIDKKREERAELKKKLGELEIKRNKFVAEKRKESADGEETLDEAMIKAINKQAGKRNFKKEVPATEKKERPAEKTEEVEK